MVIAIFFRLGGRCRQPRKNKRREKTPAPGAGVIAGVGPESSHNGVKPAVLKGFNRFAPNRRSTPGR
jgi:hypothetical protein